MKRPKPSAWTFRKALPAMLMIEAEKGRISSKKPVSIDTLRVRWNKKNPLAMIGVVDILKTMDDVKLQYPEVKGNCKDGYYWELTGENNSTTTTSHEENHHEDRTTGNRMRLPEQNEPAHTV